MATHKSQTPYKLSNPILIGYYSVLALLWITPFFPEARLWGLDWYRYFGFYGRIVTLVLAAVLPWVAARWYPTRPGSESNRFGWYAVLFIITYLALAWFGRSRTFFLGDGYQVLAKVSATSEVLKPWDRPVWTIQTVSTGYWATMARRVGKWPCNCYR